MWEEPSLGKHFPTYKDFDLVATTSRTIYNETAKSAGLATRTVKFIPKKPGEEAPKRMPIQRGMGDKQDPKHDRPQQQGSDNQQGKRSSETGAPSFFSSGQ